MGKLDNMPAYILEDLNNMLYEMFISKELNKNTVASIEYQVKSYFSRLIERNEIESKFEELDSIVNEYLSKLQIS